MINDELQELCLALLQADSETEVIRLLTEAGYWNDPTVWRLYGDKEGNFATAGAQQAQPEAALVEKIINSVDASLNNKCLLEGIDPESAEAPNSIRQGVARFYEDREYDGEFRGVLKEWSPKQRREEAKNITLAATGTRKSTCLTIVDRGEGQTPNRIPDTILSLNRTNKQRIRFVQGKFNMGGTGVLRHLGKNSLQLIISKRNPEIAKRWDEKDSSSDFWSFTIVRRERPSGKAREIINSEFKYLAPLKDEDPKGGVLRFRADALSLMPQDNEPYVRDTSWGTAIKLYQYDMSAGSSHVLRPNGLIYRLEALLPEIALPVRMHECRKGPGLEEGQKGKSFETNLAGLVVRLETGKGDNLEVEPWDVPFSVHGIRFVAKIYVFKRNKSKTYLRNEGVIFAINGQTHGYIPKTIFGRKKVGLGRLGKDIFVMVDCSSIAPDAREDLFMTSRDRLTKGELRNAVERQLEEILGFDSKLRTLQDKRKDEEISERLEEQKPLEQILGNILKSSPTLSALFLHGHRISMPKKLGQQSVKGRGGGEGHGDQGGSEAGANKFVGKKHPTYFRFQKAPNSNFYHRNCEQGRVVRVAFETDVENEYFTRPDNPGRYDLDILEGPVQKNKISHSLNHNDGVAQWSINLPHDVLIGENIKLNCIIDDDVILNPIINTLALTLKPEKKHKRSDSKKRKRDGEGTKEKKTLISSGFELPKVIRVKEGDPLWTHYEFDTKSGCTVQGDAEDFDGEKYTSYTFYVNIDNVYLHHEMKTAKEPELIEAKYVYGNVLLGLSLIHDHEQQGKKLHHNGEDDDNEFFIEDHVKRVSRAMAPFLVPMINYLGSLSADDVSSLASIGDEE